MRLLFAIAGVIIFGALALLFLGGYVANLFAAAQPAFSPDDVNDNHSLAYLSTVFLSLVAGWFIGWGIGGALRGRDED